MHSNPSTSPAPSPRSSISSTSRRTSTTSIESIESMTLPFSGRGHYPTYYKDHDYIYFPVKPASEASYTLRRTPTPGPQRRATQPLPQHKEDARDEQKQKQAQSGKLRRHSMLGWLFHP